MEFEELAAGLYERLITQGLDHSLGKINKSETLILRETLDTEEAPEILSHYVSLILARALRSLPQEQKQKKQIALCNRVLDLIRKAVPKIGEGEELIKETGELLTALVPQLNPTLGATLPPQRPLIPLSSSDLLINDPKEPGIGHNLAREIESADAIDLICAFVRWHGLRILDRSLRRFVSRGGRLRVITTTYMGATERRAVDLLKELGADIKVSYETRITRLHAKAWLFGRDSQYDTAYIGSSNLSRSALTDGLEWNVRLSRIETPDILSKFHAAFESYWQDDSFETYDPKTDKARFDHAINARRSSQAPDFFAMDVRPYPHQQRILDRLWVERERHNRWKNLVVAATGTGKTVIAALDYKRLLRAWGQARLLFVAHRKEILEQSRHVFRAVLKDGSFGELYVDGQRPDNWSHVFASVQSLKVHSKNKPQPDSFDVVIIDEFHHAAANTYQWLLEDLKPRLLLGLTATPERTDGQDILAWFNGHMTVELRLWEALERGLLCPFQYFGVHDEVDLSSLRWTRGGYLSKELETLYTGNNARVALILEEIRKKIQNPSTMKALGFCVSIAHAEFMAQQFNQAKIPAQALSSKTSRHERKAALTRLRKAEINIIFAVDLFNEGLDIPEIDTVLFLRPTESATIFLQQLGRGLRHAEGKSCLTVLDFIGQQNARFRFDLRYRALSGASRAEVQKQIEEDFPCLPAGCSMQLDRVARDLILDNLKRALGTRFAPLIAELRSLGPTTTLSDFLKDTGLELATLYRTGDWCWSKLRRQAQFPSPTAGPNEATLAQAIKRLIHIDDPARVELYTRVLSQEQAPDIKSLPTRDVRLLLMLNFTLWGSRNKAIPLSEGLKKLWQHPAIVRELLELFGLLGDQSTFLPTPLLPHSPGTEDVPLLIHARYSLEEILTAFGLLTIEKPHPIREGVYYDRDNKRDLFFMTLKKSERHYSPTTMYRDYPISADLFHWESQSLTSESSPTGQRYIHHKSRKSEVYLFIRQTKKQGSRTMPYAFLGPASYVKHTGSKPMAITWHLKVPMPADLFAEAKLAAG